MDGSGGVHTKMTISGKVPIIPDALGVVPGNEVVEIGVWTTNVSI